MSAVSNSVTPRSIALWITLREVSRSMRWPKLLQPRPTAETRRPEPPRLRICMDRSCNKTCDRRYCDVRIGQLQAAWGRAHAAQARIDRMRAKHAEKSAA